MDVLTAIAARRSIRRFQSDPVPREVIERILQAATQAPSGKNRQPWRFVVLEGAETVALAEIMLGRVRELEAKGISTGSCEGSSNVILHAPVTILVFNSGTAPEDDHRGLKRYAWLVDVQSIGAAIQNMLLAAQDLGLGTLWICDVFCAEKEIMKWLGREDELIAAVAVGYADQSPPARPRLPWQDQTQWGAPATASTPGDGERA